MLTLARLLVISLGCAGMLLPVGPRAVAVPGSARGGAGGGASDGRLNPDPDEYYALWCAHDRLEVWREAPALALVTQIELVLLFTLAIGDTLDAGDSMTVQRHTEDLLAVYGSNGNAAPTPGQKAFSLSECIARNGGLPDLEAQPPSEPEEPPTSDSSLARLLAQADSSLDLIFAWLYEYCVVLSFGLPSELRAARGGRESGVDLEVFYAVRDQILATSEAGQHYHDLFYTHQREILAVIAVNWGRARLARETLLRFQPLLSALVEGRGAKATIKARDVKAVELFLDHLAAAGSAELAQVLADERARAPFAPLVGLNMESARALLVGCEAIADPFERAGCALGELLDDGLCAAGAIEPKLTKVLRKNVTKGQRALARASGHPSPRKVARLVAKAEGRLGAIERSLGKAALTPPECRQQLADGIAERRLLLGALP